jgi:hypothetical protein
MSRLIFDDVINLGSASGIPGIPGIRGISGLESWNSPSKNTYLTSFPPDAGVPKNSNTNCPGIVARPARSIRQGPLGV